MKLATFVIVLFLLAAMPMLAAVSVVNTWVGHGFNTGTAVTVAPANGNTLIASLCFYNNAVNTAISVVDQSSNALTLDAHVGPSSSDGCYWYRQSNQSGITSLTPSITGNAFWKLIVSEVSGLDSAPLGAIDTTGAGGSPWASGSVSANSGDIVFAAGYSDITTPACDAGTGWTLAGNDANDTAAACLIYQVAASTSSYTAVGTGFARIGYAIVYKAAATVKHPVTISGKVSKTGKVSITHY